MFKKNHRKFDDEGGNTEQRLLDAAGEIFAEFGYRTATVRQICDKASANVAAVNYYFGDKEKLYRAVLRSVPDVHAERFPSRLGLGPDASPAEQLRAYIRSLLFRIFDPGRPGWHVKIIAREMVEPTRALDSLVEEVARPLHRELAAIVRQILGPASADEDVRFCALSIMGQCVYYHHARAVLQRLYPDQTEGADRITRLVDHITNFSLAALRELRRTREVQNNDEAQRA